MISLPLRGKSEASAKLTIAAELNGCWLLRPIYLQPVCCEGGGGGGTGGEQSQGGEEGREGGEGEKQTESHIDCGNSSGERNIYTGEQQTFLDWISKKAISLLFAPDIVFPHVSSGVATKRPTFGPVAVRDASCRLVLSGEHGSEMQIIPEECRPAPSLQSRVISNWVGSGGRFSSLFVFFFLHLLPPGWLVFTFFSHLLNINGALRF